MQIPKPNLPYNEFHRKIGPWLRDKRQERNLRQQDIANLLNVSHQQVQKYEKGVTRISAAALLLLTKQFHWNFLEILNDQPTELKNDQ